MKTTRSLMILAELFVVLFAVGAAGARAQALSTTRFAGSFTLPFEVQWGTMTLPAGDYTLRYGQLINGGVYAVQVVGKAEGSPNGLILAGARKDVSETGNELVCVRNGNSGVVRALEMPAIGESIDFPLPHGVELLAREQNHGTNTQIAQVPMLIRRIPAGPNGK